LLFLRKYCFTIIWSIVIILLSIIKFDVKEVEVVLIPHIDKWIHFLLYLVLGGVLCFETHISTFFSKMLVVFYPFALGGLLELIQEFFVHRSGDWIDFFADVLGTFVGILCYVIFQKRWKKQF
jgi:VanZ family protein